MLRNLRLAILCHVAGLLLFAEEGGSYFSLLLIRQRPLFHPPIAPSFASQTKSPFPDISSAPSPLSFHPTPTPFKFATFLLSLPSDLDWVGLVIEWGFPALDRSRVLAVLCITELVGSVGFFFFVCSFGGVVGESGESAAMEVSVVARQASAAGSELLMIPARSRLQLVAKQRRRSVLLFAGPPLAGLRCRRRSPAIRCAGVRLEAVGGAGKKAASRKESSRRSAVDSPQLFVGLPVDAVSDCNTLNHAKAIAAGLKALKLLGVDGVELPVWWGVAEKEAMGKYDWSGYLALVQMIRNTGLKVRVSLYFHASAEPAITLPQWVSAIGEADPDIFFADRAGKRYKGCLSVAVDDLPVLQGKTPMQVYGDFLQSFRAAFSEFLGSTITDVLVGLGPHGELKYPSLPPAKNRQQAAGVGEFQCYDKNMMNMLKQHAEATGNHYWGLSGPHDAPHYNQSPEATNFFREHGGSWETPYGNFFLSWYAERLLSHADRLLSVASAAFGDLRVALYGKLPVMHAWYRSRSHPAELTAGFYNTASRDGYGAVAEVFARHSCGMVLPSMDLSDEHQLAGSRSSPESLLGQIIGACHKHGVPVAGENSSKRGVPDNFGKIKETLSRRDPSGTAAVSKFTYQRMGAYFFSPEHFPLFTQFVRSLDWSGLHPDDLPAEDGETIPLTVASSAASEGSRQMQAV